MALLILVREIDLSVAAIVALAAMGIGYAAEAGFGPAALFAVALGIGLLCGAFNGVLVTLAGCPPSSSPSAPCRSSAASRRSSWATRRKTNIPPAFLDLGQSYFVEMKETGIPWLFVRRCRCPSCCSWSSPSSSASCCTGPPSAAGSSPSAPIRWRRAFPASRWTGCASLSSSSRASWPASPPRC